MSLKLWHSEEQKTPKTVAGEQKWHLRGRRDHRSCHNIFRGSQIWDSYHVKFTFVLASWTRMWDCWTFHTQPFTHTVLCSVKLPSDVALSEQWLWEPSPWGLSHLCKQERPGGDICCLVWILMTHAPLSDSAHTSIHLCTPQYCIWSECSSNQCLQRQGAICTSLLYWRSFEGKDFKEVCSKDRNCSHTARIILVFNDVNNRVVF